MFFNVGNFDLGKTYNVTIEVYVGHQLVQSQNLSAPATILQMNFLQLVKQISQEKQPMKIVMKRTEQIWDNFENKTKEVIYILECQNWSEEE